MYKPTYNENDRGCRLLWKACSSKWADLVFLLLLQLLALLLLLLLLFYFLNQGKPPGVAKITKHAQNVWQYTLRWPLVTNIAIVQRDNWILVTKTNMLEHPLSSSPVACSNRSRTEENPCWLTVRLHRNRDKCTLWWESDILNHYCCFCRYYCHRRRRFLSIPTSTTATHRCCCFKF